jgi:hypothetical protein
MYMHARMHLRLVAQSHTNAHRGVAGVSTPPRLPRKPWCCERGQAKELCGCNTAAIAGDARSAIAATAAALPAPRLARMHIDCARDYNAKADAL